MVLNETIPAIIAELEPQKVYKITEEELELLEDGIYRSVYLNLAVTFITCAFSATIACLTVENSLGDDTIIFIKVIMYVGYIIGGLLFFIWWKTEKIQTKIIARIKSRLNTGRLYHEKVDSQNKKNRK